jgi:hypothetical protein
MLTFPKINKILRVGSTIMCRRYENPGLPVTNSGTPPTRVTKIGAPPNPAYGTAISYAFI